MRYQIDRYSPDGVRLNAIEAAHKLIYTKTKNAIGGLQLVLPARLFNTTDWQVGQVLEVWREKNGMFSLQNESVYFVQDWDLFNDRGRHLLRVYALDGLWLLHTRIIAAAAGSAKAEFDGKADDIMKAIIRNEMGVNAIAERRIPGLSVQANNGQSEQTTKGCAWQNVLSVCQELAESATEKGLHTSFDIVRTGVMEFEFRTYTGQRGVDHSRASGDPRFVGEDYGNLKDAILSRIHSEEVNYIYAGGQGEGEARVIKEVSDDVRIGEGYPFNRKEHFRDSRHQEDAQGVEDDAYTALNDGKPKTVLNGNIIDTNGMQYGIDYGFGDVLSVEAFGTSIDCHVESVSLVYDSDNGEEFTIRLQGKQ